MNTTADKQRAARAVAAHFPGVHAWYGEHTHQWWAMVRLGGGDRLLSAPDVRQLREEIINVTERPWHQR